MKTTISVFLKRFIFSELSPLLFFFHFFAHFANFFLQLFSAAGWYKETCLRMPTGNYLLQKWRSYSLLFYSSLLEQKKKEQQKLFLMGVVAPPTSRRDLRLLLDIPKTRLVAFIF